MSGRQVYAPGLARACDIVQEARLSRRTSYRALAAAMGLSNPFVADFCKGHRRLSAAVCIELAKYLPIDAEQTFAKQVEEDVTRLRNSAAYELLRAKRGGG